MTDTATMIRDAVLTKPWFHNATEEDLQWIRWLIDAEQQERPKYRPARTAVASRPPETQEERDWVCGAWAHRGRGELKSLCFASSRAVAFYKPDLPTLTFLYDHIGDESHHSIEMIGWASRYNPGTDYWVADPAWEGVYGDPAERVTRALPDNGSFEDYLMMILPIETGMGLGVRPYSTFAVQIKELVEFSDEVLHIDESMHFVFFMYSIWKRLQQANGEERARLQERVVQRYRTDLDAMRTERMRFWQEVLIPHCGADAEVCGTLPELRRQRFGFILGALGIQQTL